MNDEPGPSMPASARRDPVAAPTWIAGFAAGLSATGDEPIGWMIPLASAAAAVIGVVIWATDNPVSARWPRSRRPQWAARALLVAAILTASPWGAISAAMAACLGGAGAAIVARDLRPRRHAPLFGGVMLGAAAGLVGALALDGRTCLALSLVALLAAAMGCLVSAFRGGPGRVPVRPADVAWLYGLGALVALAMALPR